MKIATLLQEKNIKIKCYDPSAMNNAKLKNDKLLFFNSAYEACEGVNAIIIGTEWNEFRSLNYNKILKNIKEPIIFDLRNIYKTNDTQYL